MKPEEVIEQVIKDIVPSEEEVKRAREAEKIIRERLENLLKDSPIEYRFLGSYARGTWLPESLEIDVFLLFPEDYPMEELEKIGLEIGKKIVDEYELRYAAHPYVHGVVKGVEVDIVPCYKLKSPKKIKSAVDRTPFHHEWLKDRITGKENEVRLLKRFLKSSNLYGAEFKIKGFSGYLCELLIIFYESFLNLVKNATQWRRNIVIDVKNKEIRFVKGQKNIFVIDPVDEKRNVAANLSVDNFARFIEKCRLFLENPSEKFFYPQKIEVDELKLKSEIEGRFIYAIKFDRPPIVEDNLYTQLEKAEKRIKNILEQNEVVVLRSDHFANDKCYILIETLFGRLSHVKKHYGPPIEDYKNSMKFIEKNRDYSRFFENGRYVTYKRRKLTEIGEILENAVKTEYKSMGKDVSEFIKSAEILRGLELLEIKEKLVEFLGMLV